MSDADQVFLSYSRNDLDAAESLRLQLEQHGLAVFKDDQSIREGDLWLNRLQEAVDACCGFVLLVGRDGVSRWIGAETSIALIRHYGPHKDGERLPIFPILLGDTRPETLPALLRLFQATPWSGRDPLPQRLLDQVRARSVVANEAVVFDGCPYVGLDAFRIDQARLFFGRQKETLDALACFDTRRGFPPVRWLEINGNSGSGKSSLMNAGLLPLVDQGWLWPRTGTARWLRIGPLMPGQRPVGMLAESLVRFSRDALNEPLEMADVRRTLEGDDRGLADWLRSRKQEDTAFLLAIDQFEELFTFADPEERKHFDRLLATALADADCPLFLISTVRLDFLDRFEDLPRLVSVRNRYGKAWTLPPIGEDGLRKVIDGPAWIARLDVSEIRETLIDQAREEPGALPLVENALHWLWEQRKDNRLSGALLTAQGGLAGILSHSADSLLAGLGKERRPALELLFRLVKVDLEGQRHTRRRMRHTEAIAVAGGGEVGLALVNRLAGGRARDGGRNRGPLRLITVTEEAAAAKGAGADAGTGQGRWVNLIHETLIRSKGLDEKGKPQPYWPTLWSYIEANKNRAARRERLELEAREWAGRRGLARLSGLAGWSGLVAFRGLAARGSIEQSYLRWSWVRAMVLPVVLIGLFGFLGENLYWSGAHDLPFTWNVWKTRWAYTLGADLPLPKLVRIPAEGLPLPQSFSMGSESGDGDEQPVHPVTITNPFYLSATEVTFDQYDLFCRLNKGCDRPDGEDWGRGDRPVIYVSWEDAKDYVNWLSATTSNSCRLPSEAEWEYAARAGTTTAYALPAPNGSDDIAGKGLANCNGCGGEWDDKDQTAPVGSFKPNAWGLHDMHGNVWEWVEDCWHSSYEGTPPTDGTAWLEKNDADCGKRVLRGGSWGDFQVNARSAHRYRNNPGDRNVNVGFRVLCSSPISGH